VGKFQSLSLSQRLRFSDQLQSRALLGQDFRMK